MLRRIGKLQRVGRQGAGEDFGRAVVIRQTEFVGAGLNDRGDVIVDAKVVEGTLGPAQSDERQYET